jgi:hypothetical protein
MQQKYITGSNPGASPVSSGSSTGLPRAGLPSTVVDDLGGRLLNRKLTSIPPSTASKQASVEPKHQDACRLAIQLAHENGILITLDCK